VRTQGIELSTLEVEELNRRVVSASIPQREGRRAHVILLTAQGKTRKEVARLTGYSLPTVSMWCQRFQIHRIDGLADKPGRGRKPIPNTEDILNFLIYTRMSQNGKNHWSCRKIARLSGVSSTTVHKIQVAIKNAGHEPECEQDSTEISTKGQP
jgi:transposase